MEASNRKLFMAAGLLLILASAVYIYQSQTKNTTETGVNVGQSAIDIQLETLYGETFSISDFRGKLLVIDFMALSCGPCINQLDELAVINMNPDVEVISINLDPTYSLDFLKEFEEDQQITWHFASAPELIQVYQVSAIPDVLLIDRDGVIVYRKHFTTVDDFNELFQKYG